MIARHTHFGVETSYVIEGSVDLEIEGLGAKTYSAGEGFQVPTGVVHGGKSGDKPTTLLGGLCRREGQAAGDPGMSTTLDAANAEQAAYWNGEPGRRWRECRKARTGCSPRSPRRCSKPPRPRAGEA